MEIAARLLAPLGNETPIKLEYGEDTKLSYDSELEEGEIDERMVFVKQEIHTEPAQCTGECFSLSTEVDCQHKHVQQTAGTVLAVTPDRTVAVKIEATHITTGMKRRAEEPEEDLIVVKKERLED
ncbi:hypothetical protein FRC12_024503 [Ceratobasidium sp. 428]|nr:hypothetical protein FRC12_024503 [Ceratobasidium sp. 428]